MMNLGELTGLIGVPIAFLGVVTVPLWLNKRTERRLDKKEAERVARELADGTEVSWEKINLALARERDKAQNDLKDQASRHYIEIQKMREQHQQEIAGMRDRWEKSAAEMRLGLDREASEMKQRYDEQISTLSTRLAECQKTVNSLYRELYELQRQLPPTTSGGTA